MIKIAFWYDRPPEYSGGLNYMRNLLFALSTLNNKKIQPYIFFGKRVGDDVVQQFEELATVVRVSLLDRMSLAWFLHQILFRYFGSLLMIHLTIRRHGISILSHADNVYGKSRPFRIISWIPDFQYLHLPELFPLDPATETKRMQLIAAQSDVLILSSYSALGDYLSIASSSQPSNVTVLPFVSQPSGLLQKTVPSTRGGIETKYGFQGRFFFLPNQFWQHKNHAVAFAAVKALKDQGIEVILICTGNLRDYRLKDNMTYVDSLRRFIEQNDLSQNIRILGLIDYADVLFLMRHCVAVLNPSRFEGWSSTVEEAKSIGKPLILSSIPVHREQDPPGAIFFELDDKQALAQAMANHWVNSADRISPQETQRASADLQRRTIAYAEGYVALVLALER